MKIDDKRILRLKARSAFLLAAELLQQKEECHAR